MVFTHLFRNRPRAFTLVELIISMTIFTIFIGVVTTTYLSISRSLRHAAEVRQVYGEARFLMDKLTQDVRLNTIDYACLEDPAYGTTVYGECALDQLSSEGVTSVLPLISADGEHRIVYHFEGEGIFSVLKLDWDGNQWNAMEGYYTGFQPFEMDSVVLDSVQFMVKPLTSPYDHTSDNAAQYQPSVHVMILAKSTSTLLDDVLQVQMQSTISSRVYATDF